MEHRRNIEDQCNRAKNRKFVKKHGAASHYAEKKRHNTS